MVVFSCLTSIFSLLVSINNLHSFEEEICFPNSGCHGNMKDNFSVIIATVAKRKKMLHQKQTTTKKT